MNSPESNGIDNRKGVQSVDRAFEILKAFERSEKSLGVTDIARITGMAPSQVHHYLVSLTRVESIRQRPDGTYELGTFTLQLGLSALRRLEPVECAVQAARAFRDTHGGATFIALWGSHGATIIRYFEGIQPLTVEVRAGLVMPLLTSATGHVFLTWLNDNVTSKLLPQQTEFDLDAIRTNTREAGLGRVQGTLLPRISALSAPIFDADGHLAFSITTLGWNEAFDDSLDGVLANELREAGLRVSLTLGHSP